MKWALILCALLYGCSSYRVAFTTNITDLHYFCISKECEYSASFNHSGSEYSVVVGVENPKNDTLIWGFYPEIGREVKVTGIFDKGIDALINISLSPLNIKESNTDEYPVSFQTKIFDVDSGCSHGNYAGGCWSHAAFIYKGKKYRVDTGHGSFAFENGAGSPGKTIDMGSYGFILESTNKRLGIEGVYDPVSNNLEIKKIIKIK